MSKCFVKVLLTILCFIASFSEPVSQTLDTSRYTFIQYQKNPLVFPGDAQSFSLFFDKMQELQRNGEGNVNIMHIGGSHVQAGVWTEGIFHAIGSRIPGVHISRGMVFPYAAIGSTQPGDYLIGYKGYWSGCRNTQRDRDCPLGLMGISASTQDSSASLTLSTRPGRGKELQIRRVKVFHQSGPDQFAFAFPNDSLAVISRDSTDSYTIVEFSHVIDTLFLQLVKTAPEQNAFSLFGIRLEDDQAGICVDAIGNNGADLPAYLRCDLFEQQLKAAVPDLVILSVGINDAYTRNFNSDQYKSNYGALIAKIKSVAPGCAILFTTNNDSYYRRRYPNANGVRVQQAILELAKEYDAGVWDLYEVMGGYKSINQWVSARLARTDRIHFTSGGYLLIGELLSEALVNAALEFSTQPATGG